MNEGMSKKDPKIAPFTLALELKLGVKRRYKVLGFTTEADYLRSLIRDDLKLGEGKQ